MAGLKKSFVRYCIIGAVNIVINIGLTAFMHEVMDAPEELAYAVGLVTVFVLNYFLSRHFIYEASDGCPKQQFTRFLISSASFRCLEYMAFLLVHTVLDVYYLTAAIGVQLTSFVAKFFFYRAFVFVGGRRAEAAGQRNA